MARWVQSILNRFDPTRRAHKAQVRRYKRDHGKTAVTSFDGLQPDPLMIDFGGYLGEWAAAMIDRHGGTCHVFEPHPGFAGQIRNRFAADPRIIVHASALGSRAGQFQLSDDADASSALKGGAGAINCTVEPASAFFDELGDHAVDVAKLNIEGGEYDLLPAMAECGALGKIGHLLIQFHDFAPEHRAAREAIRQTLAQTHDCVWDYPFVWEYWRRKH